MSSIKHPPSEELLATALQYMARAYAPYSKFHVGSALLTDHGKIFGGCNIENVSYSLTECAERVALFSAVAQGCTNIKALAVATKNLGSPCGACRQVIWELCGDIPIYLVDLEGNSLITSSSKLLPSAFKLQS